MKRTRAAALPLLLALCPAVPGSAAPPDGGDAVARVLRAARAALGGAALDRRMVLRLDGSFTQSGLAGTSSQWQEIGGRRFAESYRTDPLAGADGYDGTAVWNRDRSGLVWVDGGQAGRAQEMGAAFAASDVLWSADRGGAAVTWGGVKTDGGRAYETLAVTPPDCAVPFELWIDRTTHLPGRVVQTLGPNTSVSTFADYRRVAGIMVPFKTHSESNGNTSETQVTTVAVDPPDADANLRKPASDVHDFAIAGNAPKTAVPFDLVENHVYLNVMLNGKGPFRFIFDTGAQNLVDPQVARDVGAAGAGSAQGGGVGDTTEALSFANIDTLSVGEATLKNQLFAVAPVRQGFGMSGGQPVDGLIGFEVLARFNTTFDYANERVELALPGTVTQPAAAAAVPFVLNGQQPEFPCTIDTVASRCTLDTGSRDSLTLYAPFMAEHPQIVPSALTAPGVNGFGFGGPALGKLGRLTSVGIGTFTLPGIIADVTTQTKGAFAQPFLAANVGGGLLKRFAVFLDYGSGTMTLTPNAAFDGRDTYERAGLFLINKNGRKTVLDVRPGTPAQAAGIAKGDVIVSIDGKDVALESLADVRAVFFGTPGTVVALGLTTKDGMPKTVKLTLEDFV